MPGKSTDKSPAGRQTGEYPCRVWRAEAPGYYLLEPSGVTVSAGMLVALNTDNRLIQLGVIAGSGSDGAAGLVPFELLADGPVPVTAFTESAPAKPHQAILAKLAAAREGGAGLFSKSLRLRGGETFALEREGQRQRCKVLRVRESSREFREYEIAVDADPI